MHSNSISASSDQSAVFSSVLGDNYIRLALGLISASGLVTIPTALTGHLSFEWGAVGGGISFTSLVLLVTYEIQKNKRKKQVPLSSVEEELISLIPNRHPSARTNYVIFPSVSSVVSQQIKEISHFFAGEKKGTPYLSKELIFKIFSFLPAEALGRSAQVCRLWREVSQFNPLWQSLCEQENLDIQSHQNARNTFYNIEIFKQSLRKNEKISYSVVEGNFKKVCEIFLHDSVLLIRPFYATEYLIFSFPQMRFIDAKLKYDSSEIPRTFLGKDSWITSRNCTKDNQVVFTKRDIYTGNSAVHLTISTQNTHLRTGEKLAIEQNLEDLTISIWDICKGTKIVSVPFGEKIEQEKFFVSIDKATLTVYYVISDEDSTTKEFFKLDFSTGKLLFIGKICHKICSWKIANGRLFMIFEVLGGHNFFEVFDLTEFKSIFKYQNEEESMEHLWIDGSFLFVKSLVRTRQITERHYIIEVFDSKSLAYVGGIKIPDVDTLVIKNGRLCCTKNNKLIFTNFNLKV